MPVHDWTRVHAGEFHHFHNAWIVELSKSLNGGLLPEGYYALGEQHASQEPEDRYKPDVLALELRDDDEFKSIAPQDKNVSGGIALLEAPPQTSLRARGELAELYAAARRTLTIRHVSSDRPVALVEIASPGNKDRRTAVSTFIDKCVAALQRGLHLVVIDLFPPRPHDPGGLALTVADAAGVSALEAPPGKRVPAASFESANFLTAYAEPFGVGDNLPPLPLFYRAGWYVELPLESTYAAAFAGVPRHLRARLEA